MATMDSAAALATIDALIDDLRASADVHRALIDAVHPTHRAGAENLVHYQTLREHDLRLLQAALTAIGATRLTSTEPSVLPKLQAAHNIIKALTGAPAQFPIEQVGAALAAADDQLEDNATALLGDADEQSHSRIMVTLPAAAAEDLDLVRGFVDAGMDLARINCAHDDAETWKKMIDNVRTAADEAGVDIKVSMDLAGPKLRTGAIAPGPEISRARVTRTNYGKVLTPSKLWITPEGAEVPEMPELPGRPALNVQVDEQWYADLEVDSRITLTDTRGSRREFFVVEEFEGAKLAHGQQNAYISNTTLLNSNWVKARVSGIPASEQRLRLHTGDQLVLTTDPAPRQPEEGIIGCTLPEAVEAIEKDQPVLFDDGAIAARAVDKRTTDDGHTEVVLEITRAKPDGTNLAAYKGINLPATELPLPSLTDEDLQALEFVAHNADIANVSFIRTPDDVRFLLDSLEEIAQRSADPDRVRALGLVLKIETIPGYENLAAVLLEGMKHEKLGLMIARGDLAVELGFERMAEVPNLIALMAEAAHVPVVMATQVLESLAKSGLPSRAEITDAAFALRMEAVMLNKGPHITAAIKILHSISRKLGRSQRKNRQMLRKIRSWENTL